MEINDGSLSPLIKYLLTITLIIFTMSIIGCSGSNGYSPEKMDTALKQKITSLEKTDPDTPVQFLGKCNTAVNAEMEEKLRSTGVSVESIVNDIFTATGTIEGIKKISGLDFVISLELAKRLEIK